MNYQIEIDEKGQGYTTWETSKGILNNVFLSVKIKRGSWFKEPDYGLEIRDIKRKTESNRNLLQQRYEEALNWMYDARRASSINVEVTDRNDGYNVVVDAIGIDGIPMQFTDFVQVGGPSDGFGI